MISRRGFFFGLGAAAILPAVGIAPVQIVQVSSNSELTLSMITREAIKRFVNSNAFIRDINRQNTMIGAQLRIQFDASLSGAQ